MHPNRVRHPDRVRLARCAGFPLTRTCHSVAAAHTAVSRPAAFRLHGGIPPADQKKLSALSLLVLGVLADDHDLAFSLDDLALLADLLNGRFHFHR